MRAMNGAMKRRKKRDDKKGTEGSILTCNQSPPSDLQH